MSEAAVAKATPGKLIHQSPGAEDDTKRASGERAQVLSVRAAQLQRLQPHQVASLQSVVGNQAVLQLLASSGRPALPSVQRAISFKTPDVGRGGTLPAGSQDSLWMEADGAQDITVALDPADARRAKLVKNAQQGASVTVRRQAGTVDYRVSVEGVNPNATDLQVKATQGSSEAVTNTFKVGGMQAINAERPPAHTTLVFSKDNPNLAEDKKVGPETVTTFITEAGEADNVYFEKFKTVGTGGLAGVEENGQNKWQAYSGGLFDSHMLTIGLMHPHGLFPDEGTLTTKQLLLIKGKNEDDDEAAVLPNSGFEINRELTTTQTTVKLVTTKHGAAVDLGDDGSSGAGTGDVRHEVVWTDPDAPAAPAAAAPAAAVAAT